MLKVADSACWRVLIFRLHSSTPNQGGWSVQNSSRSAFPATLPAGGHNTAEPATPKWSEANGQAEIQMAPTSPLVTYPRDKTYTRYKLLSQPKTTITASMCIEYSCKYSFTELGGWSLIIDKDKDNFKYQLAGAR